VSPVLWHAHEMLFGFAVAVIVGFLLTAGKAWTGLATPRGAVLGALAGSCGWRPASRRSWRPYALYAALDLLLLPVVAAVLVDVLVRARNRRNLPLAGILLLLAVANAGVPPGGHRVPSPSVAVHALHAGWPDRDDRVRDRRPRDPGLHDGATPGAEAQAAARSNRPRWRSRPSAWPVWVLGRRPG
jgi:uncharacterized protein involved in response to NO